MMVIVGITVLFVTHLQPNIEMNWNLLKFLPEVASCQTNFNVCSPLSTLFNGYFDCFFYILTSSDFMFLMYYCPKTLWLSTPFLFESAVLFSGSHVPYA